VEGDSIPQQALEKIEQIDAADLVVGILADLDQADQATVRRCMRRCDQGPRANQGPHQLVSSTHPRHDLCHLKNKNSAGALVFKVDALLVYPRPNWCRWFADPS
jgi:hypothetical protein